MTGTGRDSKIVQTSSSQRVMGKGPLFVANEAMAELELGFISSDEQLLQSCADPYASVTALRSVLKREIS